MQIAYTPGEGAGIGANLAIIYAQKTHKNLLVFADPDFLIQRAKLLNLTLNIVEKPTKKATELTVYPIKCREKIIAAQLNTANVSYVLNSIQTAANYCINNNISLITGPIHKGIINESGIKFSGHTEFLAKICKVEKTVMMLASKNLKIALTTTHLPLKNVSKTITKELLEKIITIIDSSLQKPIISVCGLNPHAGENGYLGDEEINVITPVIKKMQNNGFKLVGPVSADTAFTANNLKNIDVVLAMYHDQGLPVIKAYDFATTINITLGLPFNRVSVAHGTALNLSNSININIGSFLTAIKYIINNNSY